MRLIKFCVMLLLLATTSVYAADRASLKLVLPASFDKKQTAMAYEAKEVLFSVCPDLQRFSKDIESVTAWLSPVYGFQEELYGWRGDFLEIDVKITEGASKVPLDWYANGHTLQYRLGKGKRPGIDIMKDQAARFCGARVNDANAFISEPKVGTLDF